MTEPIKETGVVDSRVVKDSQPFIREIWNAEWSKFAARASLACLPAVALPLMVGLYTGAIRSGVIMAAGAVSVGFGSFQQISNRRVLPMVAAAAGICVSSWIGTLAGISPIASVVVSALAAAAYAAISFSSPGISWVSLQSLIWLVISTAYPARGTHIPVRGSLLLCGGLLQTLFIVGFWKFGHAQTPPCGTGSGPEFSVGETLRLATKRNSPQAMYAIRAALTLGIAMILYRTATFSNAYWIPMTVVLVLKADRQQLLLRAIQRMLGTIGGAALATAIVVVQSRLPYPRLTLAMLVLLFVWLSYTFLFVNYGVFAVCLTSYVIFILSLAGLPERSLVNHRVMGTLIGGSLVIASDVTWLAIATVRIRSAKTSRAEATSRIHPEA